MKKKIRPPETLKGSIVPPGDKSVSHRAAILNAVADGSARIDNFLPAEDCRSTVRCLRALGVDLSLEEAADGSAALTVNGRGLDGLREADDVLDAGNSGTTMRLLAGLLAGRLFLSVLTGDASLRSRPMARVIAPLVEMGATIRGRAGNTLAPLVIGGGPLKGIFHQSPVASAQVKSALLLAGLQAEGDTSIEEPALSRDHTERMLRAMGADVRSEGANATLFPPARLRPLDLRVPGDFSAAAFWLVAAVLHPNAEVRLRGVGVNPTRTGLLQVLRRMGADVDVSDERIVGGEPVADLVARSSRLEGTTIEGAEVVCLIDEVPVLALAGALAKGKTIVRDAAELRVKESDRLRAIAEELRRLGARIEEQPGGLAIEGVNSLTGAVCDSRGDHRLAMALAVAGLVAGGETIVENAEAAGISYPGFWRDMDRVAATKA